MSKTKAMDGLTVGRVVHYVTPSAHCAALVIGVVDADTGVVNLAVFQDGLAYGAGPIQATAVPYAEDPQPHTWHWIEKA